MPRARAGRWQAQVCAAIYGKYCDNSINVPPYRYRYNMQMRSHILAAAGRSDSRVTLLFWVTEALGGEIIVIHCRDKDRPFKDLPRIKETNRFPFCRKAECSFARRRARDALVESFSGLKLYVTRINKTVPPPPSLSPRYVPLLVRKRTA